MNVKKNKIDSEDGGVTMLTKKLLNDTKQKKGEL